MVGAGATADRSANQVVRPGCLGLHSRRRDALTAAPQQDTAPLPNIKGEHLFWINVTPTDVPDIDELTIGASAPEPSYDIS